MNYILNVLFTLTIIAFILIFISSLIYTIVLKLGNKCRLLKELHSLLISILMIDVVAIILAIKLLECLCIRNILISI